MQFNGEEWYAYGEKGNDTDGDRGLLVEFEMYPLLNQRKSDAEGRAIYDDVEFVRIKRPGDKTHEHHAPVREKDRARFREHYKAFLEGRPQAGGSGTPLSEVPFISAAQVKELHAVGFRTVEQLVRADHTAPGLKYQAILGLQSRIKDWLAQTKDNGHLTKMRGELEQRDQLISAQGAQLADLTAKMNALLERMTAPAANEDKEAPPQAKSKGR